MPLTGTVQGAPDASLGFDANTIITPAAAAQFAAQGFTFCVRYLSRGPQQAPRDLSTTEAENILTAGLALMPVQHVRKPGWAPTADLGTSDGTNAAANATSIGFPAGINIWCDLEGIAAGTSTQDAIDYCTAWFNAASAGGFVPGLYVGADAILNGDQLFALPFQHYWKSISRVPPIPVRGYQMIQTPVEETVNGIDIDKNTTQTDAQGGTALWLAPVPDSSE